MRPGLSLLAALGLGATTVWAPIGLAQGTTAAEPAIAAQGEGGERSMESQPGARPMVARARLASTEYPFTRGQALFRQSGANQTAVIVTVYGLEPGSEHVNHIHNGSCTGGILFPLEKLIADETGVARSVSSVAGALNPETWWVNVHAGYSLPSPGITCGQVQAPPARTGDGPGRRSEGGDRPSAPPAGAPPPAPERR
jgi:hypothetical protein